MPVQTMPTGPGHAFDRERTANSPPSHARSALPYLRHTPLLI